jgi:hypothetical protein
MSRAEMKIVERLIDAIVFAALVVVAVRTNSEFIRMVGAAAAVLLLIGWFVAWRRRAN